MDAEALSSLRSGRGDPAKHAQTLEAVDSLRIRLATEADNCGLTKEIPYVG